MSLFRNLINITTLTLFVIIFNFFSTLQAKNLDKYNNATSISDYFSGIVLLNQSKYGESYRYFRKLDGLENSHPVYSSKYLYSLINSGNFQQAFNFSKKLERENKDSFESDLILGIYYLKNSKLDLSNKYFSKAKNRKSRTILDGYIASSLNSWSQLSNYEFENALINIDQLDNRLLNLKKIQKVFLNCFFENKKTEQMFNQLVFNEKTDFSRYNYFFAKYLMSIGMKEKAKKIVDESLKLYPRNLLLNQLKLDQNNSKDNYEFDCKKKDHVVAEILYIASNALSSQSIYPLSNFYLNLAKFLNPDFHTFDTLQAENFFKINDYEKAIAIYKRLSRYGDAFKWYSSKQISRILILDGKKEKSIKYLSQAYDDLDSKSIYETYDYAEFLKNNEEFKDSIKFYTEILDKIDSKHPLFADVKDGRGVAYERVGKWEKAEKDLLASLDSNPNQAYVINYLAYSWIEQGVKIEESLNMLKKANKLKSNDPFIIDSLGWALFKLERYEESKNYLQLAVRLMPADPVVNDHYGDALWKNGKEIQARYYWNYVLDLKETEQDLRKKIKKKIIKGL